jgi:hypothetical protein
LTDFPYAFKVSSLRDFLKKIPELGPPTKITVEYLESLGYKSKNDRAIIGVLKFIGFLDQSGVPNEKYRLSRDKGKSRSVMAEALRQSYSELFAIFPDAQNKDNEALKNFFSTRMSVSGDVIADVANTFKILCEFADFDAGIPVLAQETAAPRIGGQPAASVRTSIGLSGMTINLNIQLQLPATDNTEVYDKIFQSLKKNLLER